MKKIVVLCASQDSHYKRYGFFDVWDQERDAFFFYGNSPVVAHPPCRHFCKLKAFADKKTKEYDYDLASLCVKWVVRNGGILENPAGSSLFKEFGLNPNLEVELSWFGFPARKKTWLFIHKFKPAPLPLCFDAITKKVQNMAKNQRSVTPPAFCDWVFKTLITG